MPIRAVSFDLDHTLFDRYATLRSLVPDFRKAFAANLDPTLSEEQIAEKLIAADARAIHFGWPTLFQVLVESGLFRSPPPYQVYHDVMLDSLFTHHAVPLPQTLPMLSALRAQGYLVALITNGRGTVQRPKLHMLGLENAFDAVLISAEFGIHKPDPAIFHAMAEKLGVLPGEMVYVGDHPLNDITGAFRSGCPALWVNTFSLWDMPDLTRTPWQISRIEKTPAMIRQIEADLTLADATPEKTLIVVRKGERRLYLIRNHTVWKDFAVALGSAPVGPKEREGDGRTPEGIYRVCLKKQGKWGPSLGISYPNRADALRCGADEELLRAIEAAEASGTRPPWGSALGGEIFIHGGGTARDWTGGCVALSDADAETLYHAVPLSCPVRIEP